MTLKYIRSSVKHPTRVISLKPCTQLRPPTNWFHKYDLLELHQAFIDRYIAPGLNLVSGNIVIFEVRTRYKGDSIYARFEYTSNRPSTKESSKLADNNIGELLRSIVFHCVYQPDNFEQYVLPNADEDMVSVFREIVSTSYYDAAALCAGSNTYKPAINPSEVDAHVAAGVYVSASLVRTLWRFDAEQVCALTRDLELMLHGRLRPIYTDEPCDGLRLFNMETVAVSQFAILCDMINRKIIALPKGEKVTATLLRAIQQVTGEMPAIFNNTLPHERPDLSLYTTAFIQCALPYYIIDIRHRQISMSEAMKMFIGAGCAVDSRFYQSFFTDYKFSKRVFVGNSSVHDITPFNCVTKALMSCFKKGAWLDVSVMTDLMPLVIHDFTRGAWNQMFPFVTSNYNEVSDILCGTYEYVLNTRVLPDVVKPAWHAMLAMLACMGVVELLIDDASRECADAPAYAGVRYARLTPFGEYVFNIRSSYEMPELKRKGEGFAIDDKHLIVTVLDSKSPFVSVLAMMADKIDESRYMVNRATMLAHCKTPKDVNTMIDGFVTYVCRTLPPLWKSFFDDVLKFCSPLISDDVDYEIYRINDDNEELLQLFATDEMLANLVVRAEGCRVLVPVSQRAQVVSRLKKSGYLL